MICKIAKRSVFLAASVALLAASKVPQETSVATSNIQTMRNYPDRGAISIRQDQPSGTILHVDNARDIFLDGNIGNDVTLSMRGAKRICIVNHVGSNFKMNVDNAAEIFFADSIDSHAFIDAPASDVQISGPLTSDTTVRAAHVTSGVKVPADLCSALMSPWPPG